MNEYSNQQFKTVALAVGVTVVLHALVGFGLNHMKLLDIKTPKITPPIQIEMITINQEESLEPPKPERATKPLSQPKATAPLAAPAPKKVVSEPPKPVTKPKTIEPTKKVEPVKTKEITPDTPKKEPKPIPQPKPQSDNNEVLAQQQRQAAFEAQQKLEQQERERAQKEKERQEQAERERAREKAEAETRAEAERQAKAKAEAEARARANAEADAKRGSQGGEGKGGNGNSNTSNNATTTTGSTGVLTGQALTITNASWKSQPSFNGLESERRKGTVNVTLTLTVDAKGSITKVSGINTGDKALDREIGQRIRRGKLHPFKNSNGQIMTGTAQWTIVVNIE